MRAHRKSPHKSRMYHQLSRIYDPIFTGLFQPRIRATIRSLDIPAGTRILEVGVGTGLALSAYPHHAEVTGIDLSSTMLSYAQEKVDEQGWQHISLRQMDGLNMDFPDEYFDFVTAFHVVTVVPDPNRLVREMTRVCKSDGMIVIVNHFRSERRWLAPIVDLLDPVTRRLGWRTTLRLTQLVNRTPLDVKRRFKTSSRSLFTVVTATKTSGPSHSADSHRVRRPDSARSAGNTDQWGQRERARRGPASRTEAAR